jgi:quercetin dioxygenase-like cupin family protein
MGGGAGMTQQFEKEWGVTREVFPDVWELSIKSGGQSSIHRHTAFNEFFVMAGQLRIYHGADPKTPPLETVLKAGDRLTIPAQIWHRFKAEEDTICLERYYKPDIERFKE